MKLWSKVKRNYCYYKVLGSLSIIYIAAILALKERKGSSRPAIKKYILANFKVSPGAHFDTQVAAAIKRGHAKGIFELPKGKVY